MQAGAVIKGIGRRIAKTFNWIGDRFSYNERGTGWRLTRWVLVGFLAIVPLYYIVGILWVHKIDDDPSYQVPDAIPPGASRSAAMAASLIDREVRVNGWVANDPFFLPGYFCDNMANYQSGMASALARFAVELNDFLGRARGSSEADLDLSEARLLNSPPDIWVWNNSLLPRETSESLYKRASKALLKYNQRVASGDAIFERRADNLANALDRIANDLGSSSAALFRMATEEPGWYLFDWKSDDLFYNTKGRSYAYYMLLRELKTDFESILAEKELAIAYGQMLESLSAMVRLAPVVVVNGRPGSQMVPNHLTTQGFYLLRARTQLREIVDILRA